MKTSNLLVFFVLALANRAYSNDIVELTKQTSLEFVSANENCFVIFYTSPVSRNDQKLLDEFSKLPKLLAESGHTAPIAFGKLDATEVPKFVKKNFKLVVFPKILLYKGGERFVYDAGVGSSAMLNWLKRRTKAQPIYSEYLNNQEAIEAFVGKHPHTTIFFGDNTSKDFENYIEVAKKYIESKFAHVTDEELKAHYNITARFGVLVNNTEEKEESEKVLVYTQKDDKALDSKALLEFIRDNTGATLIPFEHIYYHRMARNFEPYMVLFVDNATSDSTMTAKDAIRSIAKKIKKTFQVLVLDINGKDESSRVYREEGVREKDLPALYIIERGKNVRHHLREELSSKNVWNFFQMWKKKELKPTYKGSEPPTENDGPIKEVVHDTFEELVINHDKDVLVEFYSPGCHNCEKVAHVYEKVASDLKKVNPNLLFAKVDGVTNEVANATIKGFPTFKFYKNGEKYKPIHVYGPSSYGDFMESLKGLVSHPWVNPKMPGEL